MNENARQDNPIQLDNPIGQPLRTLLDTLDTINLRHPELEDTLVREYMHLAVYSSFVLIAPADRLRADFAMFTAAGNHKVRKALGQFLRDPSVTAARASLPTPSARLRAFQDGSVVSAQGHCFSFYFGRRDEV